MADQSVQFISKTELNAKKEEKRKAREQLLQQAKAEFEREERRREKRKAAGEDTWMLPSVSDRIADDDDEHRKKKKRKKEKKTKEKKNKKNKKKSKKEKDISSDSDSDEWVEKDSGETGDVTKPEEKDTTTAPERDGWMLFPCFSERSKSSPIKQQEQSKLDEEEIEDKKVPAIDVLGQHSKELNPYWKDGGKGLPTQKEETTKSNSDTSTTLYDVRWLKKSLQRSKEQAEEESRSLEEVVADRWESLEHLESLITEAELSQRDSEKQHSYSRDRSDRKDFRESSWKRDDNRQGRYRESDRYSSRRDCDNTRRDTRYHDRRDRNKDKHDNYDKDSEYKRTRDHDKSLNKERPHNDNVEYNKREHKSADIQNRHGSRTVNPFKRPDSGARDSKSSSKLIKPSDDSSFPSKPGSTSQGWRKKTAQENPKVNRIELAMKKHQEKSQQDSSSDSSDSEDDHDISEESKTEVPVSSDSVEAEPVKRVIPAKKITEADLNSIGAKILKAEIMGNEDQAAELKASLEQMRVDKEAQESATSTNKEPREQEVVLLTRTDKFGNTRPVSMNEMQEPKRGRRKREKATTHDDSGQRERYFADDDRYDLNEIVRREKMNSAEDYNSMFSRLASKGASKTDSDDFTLDDHFVTGAANKYSKAKEEEREKMKAIKEHQRMSSQLSKCRFCFENPDLAKHLIIAIGIKVYLAVPLHTSLTEGHCLIIPMQHQVAYTYLDEDVIDEIKVFKKGLTKMFQEMDKDVIFLETCRNLSRQHHMIIECIPVPKEEGDLAPMYFKKAILESDSEWAHNKKLIDTSKKGLIGSIPRGLPYFSVEFALDGGFAHVVEEEHLFPQYFGKEIIGGMLDLEPWTWHKPHRENFEQHKNKVLQFADWWKPYDWTKRLAKAK